MLPKVTCYTVPYGVAGFINNLFTLFVTVCLANHRTQSFLWRQMRYQHLCSYICSLRSVSISILEGYSLAICVTKGGALAIIILGKLVLTLVWTPPIILAIAAKLGPGKVVGWRLVIAISPLQTLLETMVE